MSIRNKILEIIQSTKPDGLITRLKHSEFWPIIEEHCANIITVSGAEKLFLYINNLTSKPTCACGTSLSFRTYPTGYTEYCGDKNNCIANKEIRERAVDTMKKQGGVGLANPATMEKSLKTAALKHGIASNITNISQIPEIAQKISDNNGMKNPKVVQYIREDCQQEYGVDWHSKRNDVRQKTETTLTAVYGVNNRAQMHYSEKAKETLFDKIKLEEMLANKSIEAMAEELEVCLSTIYNYLNRHELREKKEWVPEIQINDFLLSLGITNIIRNTRTVLGNGQELDFYLPDYNLAIEHCGLYSHGERAGRKRNYHRTKLELAAAKGIRLITIFSDEWSNKQDICKSRLKAILGITTSGIGARKLIIKEIPPALASEFVSKYHLQGNSNSNWVIGAFNGDVLVSVMTFTKPRRIMSQTSGVELIRYCTDGNIYPGIASRLFKFAIDRFNFDKVTSFCDLRWGTGNVYQHLGFTQVDNSKPGYWYFRKSDKREYRWAFTKQKLIREHGMDSVLSEWQMMQALGYDRIWDCGNLKFIWTNPTHSIQHPQLKYA
jgi:hypothetical protein